MNKEQMLKRLVENGLDFLKKAADDIEKHPKYSIIHFYTALELFLKARLMKEHWSLVVIKEPHLGNFMSGDFQSVSLDSARDRLEKVLDSGLSKQEYEEFNAIRKHRNKMVHFFHEVHNDEQNQILQREIVKQQLTAWYFLHRLLTEQWKEVFEPWVSDIAIIDIKLRKLHSFLQIIYDQIKPEIEDMQKKGDLFQKCPSCGFISQQHEDILKEVYDANCLVCGLTEKWLKIECPNCADGSSIVNFRSEGFGECEECGERFEPNDLVSEINIESTHHDDDSRDLGNCSNCDGHNTVILTKDHQYLCLSCFESFDSLERCGWCDEPNTGDMENSHWTGCNCCDGNTSWNKDD